VRATLFLDFDEYDKERLAALKVMEGINDFYVNETEKIIVVKYDKEKVDPERIKEILRRSE